ncbi:MAG: alcohol dehydrogenase [Rhodospirillaceae bacterium]|nr:alcohol dehydrogenase [Alphaproteobacteria bacterium]MBR71494.1 alcohol dehydrogenase [Rhodospirillaceae bacterium]|tara:strand:+ start:16061 stop:17368 length:1308 start_codon:yes stop_codon:yes gene_type:complete
MGLDKYFQHKPGGETAFTIEAPNLKFGLGVLSELGEESQSLGITRAALFVDPHVEKIDHFSKAILSLKNAGIDFEIYNGIEIEPTDRSFKEASKFAQNGKFDGYISIGGGSTMDTAKAANLYATYPAELFAYVNAPVGDARQIPGSLMPHIACPTTFGTASETTGIAIFDILDQDMKTGIAHRALRPTLGLIDPEGLTTLPAAVIASNGFDVFSHAIESYTAKPFTHRPAPEKPSQRPLLQGANPYSDMACLEAIKIVGENIEKAVNQNGSLEELEALSLAGMLAGIGFGNAGCHLPHAMSYAVAGLVKNYKPKDWPSDHPMVPHGISVIVNSPAAFRFTSEACPDRHLKAAEALGVDVRNLPTNKAGKVLGDKVIDLMKKTGLPNGLKGVGYNEADIDSLAENTLPTKRLLDISPRAVDSKILKTIFRDAMSYW